MSSSSSGSGPIIPYTAWATVNHPLAWYVGETPPEQFEVVDKAGNPISVLGADLQFDAWIINGTVPYFSILNADIETGGAYGNIITLQPTAGQTSAVQTLQYKLWDLTTKIVLYTGRLDILSLTIGP